MEYKLGNVKGFFSSIYMYMYIFTRGNNLFGTVVKILHTFLTIVDSPILHITIETVYDNGILY